MSECSRRRETQAAMTRVTCSLCDGNENRMTLAPSMVESPFLPQIARLKESRITFLPDACCLMQSGVTSSKRLKRFSRRKS